MRTQVLILGIGVKVGLRDTCAQCTTQHREMEIGGPLELFS